MGEDAAHVRHQAYGVGEELGPGWGRQGAYQNRAGQHVVELRGAQDYTCPGGDAAGAHGEAAHGVAGVVVLDLRFLERDAFDVAGLLRHRAGRVVAFAGLAQLAAFGRQCA